MPSQAFVTTILALPDAGADLDAIPESVYEQHFPGTALRPDVTLCTAVGSLIITLGCFKDTINWNISGGVSTATDTVIHVLRQLLSFYDPCCRRNLKWLFGCSHPGYHNGNGIWRA